MVVLGFCPEVFEDGLLPVAFHVVPVVYHSVTNRIVHTVSWSLCVCQGLISDEEVKILDATLGRQMAGFRRDRWGAGRLSGWASRRYSRRKYTG